MFNKEVQACIPFELLEGRNSVYEHNASTSIQIKYKVYKMLKL